MADEINLNNYRFILEKLIKNSFEVFFVGGCVRDSLLNRDIKDVDIVTSATPDEICILFSDLSKNDYARKYGCIEIKGEYKCQITTMREEINYADYRHPSDIKYVKELTTDVKRRDFTINALYMDLNGRVIDFFCGQEDLKGSVIRMIGIPSIRLQEDPLRILRAIRLAINLEFIIESDLENQIFKNIHLLEKLNPVKVNSELNKINDKKHRYYRIYLGNYPF